MTLTKQSHVTMTVDTKTLLLWVVTIMQVGVKFMFGQDHNTHTHIGGVYPFTEDNCGYRIQETPYVIPRQLPSFSSSSWKWYSC